MIKFGTDGWRAEIARDFTFENLTYAAIGTANYLLNNKADNLVVIGYELNIDAHTTSLMTIITALESHPEIVECTLEEHNSCSRFEFCSIRNPMMLLQKKVDKVFKETYLSEFIRNKPVELTIPK